MTIEQNAPKPNAYIKATPLLLARRFLGLKEVPGQVSNPAIVAMLQLDAKWADHDETPWCSAFANYIAWLLDLPRSKSLSARSWLTVGAAVPLDRAVPGFDVVVLQRGSGDQPGADVLDAPGHVGFYVGRGDRDSVIVLGGNQGDAVTEQSFHAARVLGIRRL